MEFEAASNYRIISKCLRVGRRIFLYKSGVLYCCRDPVV
jgi:hypothetical protein